MENENIETKMEQKPRRETLMSPQKLRLPNDLIYQLKTVTGESHGLPDQVGEKTIVLASTIPALVNFRVGSSEEEMVSNIKCGYSEGTKVPMTCMETGACFNQLLEPNMTMLVDRPFQVHNWVIQDDMIGLITSITSTVDLEPRNSDAIICSVKGSDIKPFVDFSLGMYVYCDGWIGCVTAIQHKLRILYEKGFEGYMIEKEDGFSAYRRNFSYSHVGDEISPSGQDVKDVEWISAPPSFHWFFLRYLNFGYTSHTIAEVMENEVDMVSIEWHSSTLHPTKQTAKPVQDFPREELHSLVKLDLSPDWWYGMNVKYIVKDGDEILDVSKWEEKIAQEFEVKLCAPRRKQVAPGQGDVVLSESFSPSDIYPGAEVTGKIIFRRAVADVLWEDGKSSKVRVQNLVPYYPPPGVEFPLLPGTVVYKTNYPYKAVVQTSHRDDGALRVKWFAEVSGDVPDSMKFRNESEEDTYDLDIEDSLVHIGLIVIRRTDSVPGIVVGVNRSNGLVLVKFDKDVQELETARISKFSQVAHFIQGKLVWVPLKTHPLTVQKHVVTLSSNSSEYGNTIPPQLVTHGAPVVVLTYEELPTAPVNHRFINLEFPRNLDDTSFFIQARTKELDVIKESPPEGMWIKTYADRLDLISVLMRGLPDTPFDSGLFQFDLSLPATYPAVLPKVGFVKHELEAAQVELDIPEDGVLDMDAMFGDISDLNISKILVYIRNQLLGLNQEETKASLTSYSRNIRNLVYNQKVAINLIPAITSWLVKPPVLWETEVLAYYRFEAPRHIIRMKKWLAFSRMHLERDTQDEDFNFAEGEDAKYPLLPIDSIAHAEIRNDLSDLSNAYSKIF